jgi:hypothetical protein
MLTIDRCRQRLIQNRLARNRNRVFRGERDDMEFDLPWDPNSSPDVTYNDRLEPLRNAYDSVDGDSRPAASTRSGDHTPRLGGPASDLSDPPSSVPSYREPPHHKFE